MFERMLDRRAAPSVAEMTAHCGGNGEGFAKLNEWLSETYATEQKIVFPYGNRYGWGIAHRKKNKLVCNIFPEDNAFTVMVRLSDKQLASVYNQVRADTRACLDGKYPCGDGGWIHFRVTDGERFDEIRKLLAVKCAA